MQTFIELNGLSCCVTHAEPFAAWSELRGRLAMLLLSLKNPAFTPELVQWFVELTAPQFDQAVISVVDTPYYHNLRAQYPHEDDKLIQRRQLDIDTLSFEKQRMVQRIINRVQTHQVSLIPWRVLEYVTPRWIREELDMAFAQRGAFYRNIIEQVKRIRDVSSNPEILERYAQFLLAEIPVILMLYYQGAGVVDMYPGANFFLYQMLESGELRAELPRSTEFVQAGTPLIYVEIPMSHG